MVLHGHITNVLDVTIQYQLKNNFQEEFDMSFKSWLVMATGCFTLMYSFAINELTLVKELSISIATIYGVSLMDKYEKRKKLEK
jgi:hypothetical protein